MRKPQSRSRGAKTSSPEVGTKRDAVKRDFDRKGHARQQFSIQKLEMGVSSNDRAVNAGSG